MTSSLPLITVLMPVYNTEKYVSEAIESILNQTLGDFEFIIIDDASRDGTLDIIKGYNDPRIKLILKPVNTGYTDSLNMGFCLAKAKYIARMDSDDYSLPDRFRKQYLYMEQNPDVIVLGTQYKIIGTETIISLPVTFEQAKVVSFMQTPVAHPTVFIRKEALTKNSICYNKEFEPAEDYDLWVRLMNYGKIENLPEVLLHYRNHELQESRTKLDKLVIAARRVRQEQISKLISLTNKPYTIETAIEILTKQNIQLNSDVLRTIRQLLVELYEANEKTRSYDQSEFLDYLKKIWLTYAYRLINQNRSLESMLIVILSLKSNVTRLRIYTMLKLVIGYTLNRIAKI